MKARKKGTDEWKEYKEVFGQYGEFLGLETLGYTKSVDEIIAEIGIDVEKDPYARERIQPQYQSAILPLECFDLWEEPDWDSFRREAAKDILPVVINQKCQYLEFASLNNETSCYDAIQLADELVKQLKQWQ